MMRDFTKAHSKKYQTWRVLQAPGEWATVYNDRIREFGNYRGAIIFPEQLLGLNQKCIFTASVNRQVHQSVSGGISQLNTWGIYDSPNATFLTTLDEVYEFERRSTPKDLRFTSVFGSRAFHEYCAFSNKKGALQYVTSEISKAIGCLG
jgi:hypothetical protein